MRETPLDAVAVPVKYPCATFYVDESAAKESGGSFFVVGAVKVRQPGVLARAIEDLRHKNDYTTEFKFSRITRGRLPIFCQLVDLLEASDAHIGALVVNRGGPHDPFTPDEADWLTHARVTAKLLGGLMVRRELSSALIDRRSTPVGTAFDDTVRSMVNHRLKGTGLVGAHCVDSLTHDGVQLADLVAGAVALHRRAQVSGKVNPNSHKAKIATRLAHAFGVPDFAKDMRNERTNVLTHGHDRPKGKLRAVNISA